MFEILISTEKTTLLWIIISGFKVIQSRFFIVDITTIAERIPLSQRTGQRASGTQRLAPHVVLVFYHEGTRTVKQANDIALQIVGISIKNTVVADLCAS